MCKKLSLTSMTFMAILVLLLFGVGYTYAYFSATKVVSGSADIATINVTWRDANNRDASITNTFDDKSTSNNEALSIAIKGKITRGGFSEIKEVSKTDEQVGLKLKIANLGGTADAHCRIKIDAKYTPINATEPIDCPVGWIQLALDNDLEDANDPTVITNSGNWVLHNGYYYYGSTTLDAQDNPKLNLKTISANGSTTVANFIYLSNTADTNILGSSISIVLTMEAVQKSADNIAYKTMWGL